MNDTAPRLQTLFVDHPSKLRQFGKCLLGAAAIAGSILAAGVYTIHMSAEARRRAGEAFVQAASRWESLVDGPAGPLIDAETALRGRELFLSACAACHGAGGTGGLGKNISQSDFVAGLSDAELHDFIVNGRPEAKPLPMPPKGGRDDLTSADIANIVAYLRGLQDPRRMPPLPEVASAPAAPSEDERAALLAAAGGDEELAEYIASGAKLYSSSCIACHGPNGAGIKGNGKPLANNPFIANQDDDALLAFIQKGRDPSDPANTTGVGMPAKGGNPALTEDDLLDIIAYLRTLQQKQASTQ